jgi:hypothetical protein
MTMNTKLKVGLSLVVPIVIFKLLNNAAHRSNAEAARADSVRAAAPQPLRINDQQAYLTQPGRLACATENELKEAQSLAGDQRAIRSYLRTHSCVVLQGGDTVVLASGSGVFTIRFRMPGQSDALYAANGSIKPLTVAP